MKQEIGPFLSKKDSDAEKNRMNGYNLRKHIPREAEVVCLSDDSSEALQVAEGLILSNYQFLMYRSDKAKKEYALKSIQLIGSKAKKRNRNTQ